MDKHQRDERLEFVHTSLWSGSFTKTILLFLMLLLLSGCVETKMSVKEAEDVAVTTAKSSFVPPPRRIDDITQIFDHYAPSPEETRRLKAEAAAEPPANLGKTELVEFYYKRAVAAEKLGLLQQQLDDLRTAVKLMGDSAANTLVTYYALRNLSWAEAGFGNLRACLELSEKQKTVLGSETGYESASALFYSQVGDIKNAEEHLRRLRWIAGRWGNSAGNIEWRNYFVSYYSARIMDMQGQFEKSEPLHRSALASASTSHIKPERPHIVPQIQRTLAGNLMNQGRLVEAEIAARQAMSGFASLFGIRSISTFQSILLLGEILSKQARCSDSEKLARRSISSLTDSGVPDHSAMLALARHTLGSLLLDLGRWDEALVELTLAKHCLDNENNFLANKWFLRNTSYPLAFLRTGQPDEALDWLEKSREVMTRDFGSEHYETAVALGLLGVALCDKGNLKQSYDHFSKSIPILLSQQKRRTPQVTLILERYLDLLDHMRDTPMEREKKLDAVEEMFRAAEATRGRSVQEAFAKGLARAALKDPKVSSLARLEQDTENQITALEGLLSDHLSAPPDQQFPEVVADLRERVRKLREAQATLREQILKTSPTYGEMLKPSTKGIQEVQALLRPEEALISIYPSGLKTYIWAIPARGKAVFSSVPLGESDIQKMVNNLRKSLAPDPQRLGDIPTFSLDTAYELYGRLLQPVHEGWKGARDLIIVAEGSLGHIPFSVLPTAPAKVRQEGDLFAGYRSVPWLIRQASITRIPSISSLMLLKGAKREIPQRRPFAGFGDPVYSQGQATRERQEVEVASRGIRVRGVRVTQEGSLDSEKIHSCQLERLSPLPDTADEIRGIAKTLGADEKQDVFLGKMASEEVVKKMDLSDRRIIAFASHALVPGDLDGLDQPAIALSSPAVTGEKEDGLLTMEEVLSLKLNADWVMLSACNTGAGEGAGAEAFSGLGRAFLFAGTRALLASMWSVETTSAMKLTTGLFRFQGEDPSLSRAKALQKSILDLLDNQVFRDEASGRVAASYAHPFFWAPFVVVGEGG